jgi:hypothetical protein
VPDGTVGFEVNLARVRIGGARIAALFALWALTSLSGAPCAAQSRVAQAELSWSRERGAEACGDGSTLRQGVLERLGRDPFGSPGALLIEGRAFVDQEHFRARLSVRGPDGELLGVRTLESDAAGCESLTRAVALAIALVIDPEAGSPRARDQPVDPPAPAPAAARASPREAGAITRAAPRALPGAWLDVRALLSDRLLPGIAPGFGLEAQIAVHQRLNAVIALDHWPERKRAAIGSRFAFGLTTGTLGLCVETLRGLALGLALCGSMQLGAIHAVVYELTPVRPGERFWAAAALKAQFYLVLGRARVSLAALGTAPITRHRFRANDQDDVIFRQAAVVPGGELGLGMHF